MIDKKESVKRKYSFKKDSFYTFFIWVWWWLWV